MKWCYEIFEFSECKIITRLIDQAYPGCFDIVELGFKTALRVAKKQEIYS